MKKFTLLSVLLLSSLVYTAKAVPAYPLPVDVVQADGSVITIRLHGDEYFSYATTTDGYLFKENAAGMYEYARFTGDRIVATGVLASNNRTASEKRILKTLDRNNPVPKEKIELFRSQSPLKMPETQKAPPFFTGTKKGLVILVNFTDKAFSYPKENFVNMLNQQGYSANSATGSARDYFTVSSNGIFTPEFDVFGPVTLSQNMAYYGADVGGVGNDANPKQMIMEAVALVAALVPNFDEYDTNGNGAIDNVFVYYAGHNQAEGGGANTIWPHRSYITNSAQYHGKYIRDYACSSELRGSGGNVMCGIGTFCHEFSHVLGLPDFYDTQNSNNYTIGYWSIMASGAYTNNGRTPPSFLAMERFFLGYLTPEILVDSARYTLEPIVTNNTAYMIAPPNDSHNLDGSNPMPREFFLLENRQQIDWDTYSYSTPGGSLGKGLLITRVNFSPSAWSNNTVNVNGVLGFKVIEANGTTSNMRGHTYPGSTNKTEFIPTLTNGTTYDGNIFDITEEFNDVSFCFRLCTDGPYIDIIPQSTQFKTVAGTHSPVSVMTVRGGHLEDNVSVSLLESNYFEMRLREEQDSEWVKNLILTRNSIDSTVLADIDVRYNPTEPSFNDTHQCILQAKNVAAAQPSKKIALSGKSTRPITIHPPIMKEATKITASSFQTNWHPVEGAVGYYVSVYTKGGTTTEKENFTGFETMANTGWEQTFYTTTGVSVPSAPTAVLFTSELDTLYTPYYPEAVRASKFWFRSEDTQQSGSFHIEGLGDDGWEVIRTISINITHSSATTQTANPADGKEFRRIRFFASGISSKGVAFDDFEATFNATMNVSRRYVERDSLAIGGVTTNVEYICKAQATDKDPLGRYENVTDFSMPVFVKTLDGEENNRKLDVVMLADGRVRISLTEEEIADKDIFVISYDGKLVQQIPNSQLLANPEEIIIDGLAPNNGYIITLGLKRKAKFTKIFVK